MNNNMSDKNLNPKKKKKLAGKGAWAMDYCKGRQVAKKDFEKPDEYSKYVQDLINIHGFKFNEAVELVNEMRKTEERYKGREQ